MNITAQHTAAHHICHPSSRYFIPLSDLCLFRFIPVMLQLPSPASLSKVSYRRSGIVNEGGVWCGVTDRRGMIYLILSHRG